MRVEIESLLRGRGSELFVGDFFNTIGQQRSFHSARKAAATRRARAHATLVISPAPSRTIATGKLVAHSSVEVVILGESYENQTRIQLAPQGSPI